MMNLLITTKGSITAPTMRSERTVNGARARQWVAPSVLGMISDRIRIASVMAAGITNTVIMGLASAQMTAA